MRKDEITQKLTRLQDIITEAKEIIASLEEFCKEKDELAYTPVETLIIARGGLQTKFLNVCSDAHIKTIQQLIEVGYHDFKKFRNCGAKTADLVREAIQKEYQVKW